MKLLVFCVLMALSGCVFGNRVEVTVSSNAPVRDIYVIVGSQKEYRAALAAGESFSVRFQPEAGQELTVTYKAGDRQESAVGPALEDRPLIHVLLEAGGPERVAFEPGKR